MASVTDVVLVLGAETFLDCVERGMHRPPDRLLQTLAADDRVGKVMVVDPFRSLPAHLLRTVVHGRPDAMAGSGAGSAERSFHVVQPYLLRPRSRARPEKFQRFEAFISRSAGERGLSNPALISFDLFLAGWTDPSWASTVIYYARDDASAFPRYEDGREVFEDAYRGLRERRVTVCAVSHNIIDRLAPDGKTMVVPNGVEPSEWLETCPAPTWFSTLPGPRAVYAGTLDDRLDVRALLASADAIGGGTLVLLGPLLDPHHLESVVQRPNVVVRQEQDRGMLAAVLRASDVCLIPHIDRAQTRAMSPLKLYEYLAAGRPVVSTDMAPVRGISDRVLLIEPDGDFGTGVRTALARRAMSEDERRSFIAANSWRSRHEPLLDLLTSPRPNLGTGVPAPPC